MNLNLFTKFGTKDLLESVIYKIQFGKICETLY